MLVLTLAFLGWFCLGTKMDQRVVTARLASLEVRHLTAPFQGKLVESHVAPGDRVERGDLLYRLDTHELQLQLSELNAELEVASIEIDQALAAGEVQAASLAQARRRVTEAKRASTLRRIEESSVRAAMSGTILRGDLALRIGQVVPQGEPLYELAPDAGLQLELLVPEEAAAEVPEGVEVFFSSNARPESYVSFRVESMQPAAEVIEGKNTFRAKAVSDEVLEEWMRVGMEGVARVDIGERPVWRVALGRLIDFAHQVLWL